MDFYFEIKPLLDFPNKSWYYNFFSFPFVKLQLKDQEVEEMITAQKRSQFKKNSRLYREDPSLDATPEPSCTKNLFSKARMPLTREVHGETPKSKTWFNWAGNSLPTNCEIKQVT